MSRPILSCPSFPSLPSILSCPSFHPSLPGITLVDETSPVDEPSDSDQVTEGVKFAYTLPQQQSNQEDSQDDTALVCVHPCVCVSLCVHMHVCWSVCSHACVLVCVFTCMCVGLCVHVDVCWSVCSHACVLVCVFTCMCVGLCVWILCAYLYICRSVCSHAQYLSACSSVHCRIMV